MNPAARMTRGIGVTALASLIGDLGTDIHLTPNGRFLYISECASSTIEVFSVDAARGKPTYIAAP